MIERQERPTPGRGQVLVRIQAASVNRADLWASTRQASWRPLAPGWRRSRWATGFSGTCTRSGTGPSLSTPAPRSAPLPACRTRWSWSWPPRCRTRASWPARAATGASVPRSVGFSLAVTRPIFSRSPVTHTAAMRNPSTWPMTQCAASWCAVTNVSRSSTVALPSFRGIGDNGSAPVARWPCRSVRRGANTSVGRSARWGHLGHEDRASGSLHPPKRRRHMRCRPRRASDGRWITETA